MEGLLSNSVFFGADRAASDPSGCLPQIRACAVSGAFLAATRVSCRRVELRHPAVGRLRAARSLYVSAIQRLA
ncbi:hypothetical protein NG827_08020 [Xanthomonas sacchari]|uniref:hypothetical protein n=1 Tax=Xanthomonas sacchari TaxID=56458 RepID=UPI00225A1582|nr:hypothetical protein [Xanthomonas sacchari]UYK86336.1 hypothetical protein NG827_08020 [Xanthomonas sacchari]